jgi:hypothetical protein
LNLKWRFRWRNLTNFFVTQFFDKKNGTQKFYRLSINTRAAIHKSWPHTRVTRIFAHTTVV